MSKDPDFLKVYQSGGGGRLLTGGGGSRCSLLLPALIAMSVCLGVSGATKVHWYIPEPESNRLGIPNPPPPSGSASLQPGVYFIRDNIIKVTPGSALMLPEVAVATGITSNWLITDDSGMRMDGDISLFYTFKTYSNDSEVFSGIEIDNMNLDGVFTTTDFTINFPCTRRKEGTVNFTLTFQFTSAAVEGLDALQGTGFNMTGAKYCNCSVPQCNQQPTPGPEGEGESLLGNQIFYIVVGSVVLIIIVIAIGMVVIVVTFCYYQYSQARDHVLSANIMHTDSDSPSKDIHPV